MQRTILRGVIVASALVNAACTSTQSLRDSPGATRAQICHNAATGQISGGEMREEAIALAVEPPDEWHDHVTSKGRQVSYWYMNGRRWVSFDADGRARSISGQ